MKTETIQILDLGRGPQLSTSRITVLDLMPYFQEGCSYDEIIRWIPTLSHEEIATVEQYYLEHKAECDERDRRATEHTEEQIRLQNKRFPPFEGTPEEHLSRLKQLIQQRQREKKSEGHFG